jgi:hypothetical protein
MNVITESGYQMSDPCKAVAAISSGELINKHGQINMEIFNCTNHAMTIEKRFSAGDHSKTEARR